MQILQTPLQAGDRVVLSAPASSAYVELCSRLLHLAVFPVPLDPRLTEHERAGILSDVAPVVVLTTTEEVEQALRELPIAPGPLLPLARPMHVTSGTTGRPKPVDSGLLSAADAAALLMEERTLWEFGPEDVNLVLSPMYHSAPLRFAMGTQLAGGRVVVPGPFDPVAATTAIVEERPTTMFCVPTHLQRLFAHWDEVGVPDLSSFRLVAHAGAPCPEGVKRRLIELFPANVTWEFYGATEGQFTACRSEEWLERPGTVGRARPGRRMSVDAEGHLWCHVPDYARFVYRNAPEKTSAAWRETPEGPAFSVGDLGRIDADGYVYLDGRRDDLVISGGVNVYPVEVEETLRELPGLVDVAVFGRPDADWGMRVCAAVVGDVTEEALRAWARERLAPPKRPKEYEFLADLPRTASGKVRRRDLAGA